MLLAVASGVVGVGPSWSSSFVGRKVMGEQNIDSPSCHCSPSCLFSALLKVWFLAEEVEISLTVKSQLLQVGQCGALAGAHLAGRESGDFSSLGTGRVRLICHGLPTHHLHDASPELEGEGRIGGSPSAEQHRGDTARKYGGERSRAWFAQILERCLPCTQDPLGWV